MRNLGIKMRVLGAFMVLASLVGAGPVNAACWQWSKTASSNATADPSINWAEGMSPSSVNDSARAMMARLAECRDDMSGALLTTGSSTVYAVTTNQGLNAVPTDGQQIVVRVHVTNGTAPTLAADGGTAYAIQSAPATAVASGTLIAGAPYRMTFNLAATAWLLQDFYNAPLPNNSVTYAKIQQVAASQLLGNATGSLANVAEIPLGTGLSFSGGALTATGLTSIQVPGFLSGYQLSTSGGSATFGITVGSAASTASAGMMVLGSAYTKTTSAWTVGSGNGALDTGVIAINTWYHAFAMARPDTGVVDICVSVSVAACTTGGAIPAAYTQFRRIGSMKTNGASQWTAFTQVNDEFMWDAAVADVVGNVLGGSTLFALSVPTSIIVTAHIQTLYQSNGVGSQFKAWSPLITGPGPIWSNVQVANDTSIIPLDIITNTSAQIRAQSNSVGVISFSVTTLGWTDTRGK